MDRGASTRRRARAIAISTSVEVQRAALATKLFLALVSAAIAFEALSLAQHWISAGHP